MSRHAPNRSDGPRWLSTPEVNVVIFSLPLKLAWEFWQVSFFADLAQGPHWRSVLRCTQAAVGDVFISLLAYWAVCVTTRTRWWVKRPTSAQVVIFIGVGLAVTVLLEILATRVFGRWSYSETMPVVPGLGVGLLPLAQWLLLPPIVLWFVRRSEDRWSG